MFVLDHIHDVDVVFRSSIVVVVRMSCIRVEVANVLGLIVQLVRMIKLAIIIDDFYFLL